MSSHVLVERTVKVAKDLDALLGRALGLVDDGDRVPYFVRSSETFELSENTTKELLFNIPSDANFYGRRLNLFLGAKIISTTVPATQTELTFRPVDWSSAGMPVSGGAIDDIARFASGVFHISDSMRGEYQRAPIPIGLAFSSRAVPPFGLADQMPISAFLGGLDFHADYILRKGSTMTVRFTPTASFVGSASIAPLPGDTWQFRVMGVLQGYKKAKALR